MKVLKPFLIFSSGLIIILSIYGFLLTSNRLELLALAIAILKYKLFNIHLIIRRSLVYTTLSIFIISVCFYL